MIRAFKSFLASLRASGRLGRASKLRDVGRKEEALIVAREGLAILREPSVNRTNPPEGSALSCLTVLVEELASELHVPGAEASDVLDTLAYLKRIPHDPSDAEDMAAWIPYLESRIRPSDRAV